MQFCPSDNWADSNTNIGQSSQSMSDQLTTHHIQKLTITDITWTVIYKHKPGYVSRILKKLILWLKVKGWFFRKVRWIEKVYANSIFGNFNCKLKPLHKNKPKFNIKTIEQNYTSKVHEMFKKTEDVIVGETIKYVFAFWWETFCISTPIIYEWIYFVTVSFAFMHCRSFKGHEWGLCWRHNYSHFSLHTLHCLMLIQNPAAALTAFLSKYFRKSKRAAQHFNQAALARICLHIY